MRVDVHAHYVPPRILETLERDAAPYGVQVQQAEGGGRCLHFGYGPTLRPFHPHLLDLDARWRFMEAQGEILHPVQEGFWEEHGLQCGFCTPGMLMASVQLLERNPNPTDAEIRHALDGNLCRCTGYQHIVNAVQYAAQKMRQGAGASAD